LHCLIESAIEIELLAIAVIRSELREELRRERWRWRWDFNLLRDNRCVAHEGFVLIEIDTKLDTYCLCVCCIGIDTEVRFEQVIQTHLFQKVELLDAELEKS
jgi:hypothetical protein